MFKILALLLITSIMLPSFLCSQQIIASFPTPGQEARGLTWDGSHIWIADARLDSIYKINPDNGYILSRIYFAILDEYGGLAWDEDSSIWIGNKDSLYNLDPETGGIIKAFMAPGC
ncbi:hypothetical protein KAU34_06560 [candidate division WOR-3 bacterium]|nr:hypothetical protein [candidate division WOR-3 bacterium]